ncbi:MAG: hypothetical protein WCE75_16395 [Terracidiphilus sp.]
MKPSLIVKGVLALLTGGLFGLYVQSDYEKWHRLGREAFIDYQEGRFDRFMASPHTGAVSVVIMALVVLGLAVLYELVGHIADRIVASYFESGQPPA